MQIHIFLKLNTLNTAFLNSMTCHLIVASILLHESISPGPPESIFNILFKIPEEDVKCTVHMTSSEPYCTGWGVNRKILTLTWVFRLFISFSIPLTVAYM